MWELLPGGQTVLTPQPNREDLTHEGPSLVARELLYGAASGNNGIGGWGSF